MAKEPTSIDRLVGDNLRVRRLTRGLSQADVAEALGVTSQQVQKYEKGMNRIAAARLDQIAKILKVPATYFFQDGSVAGKSEQEENWSSDPDLKRMITFVDTPEGARLVSGFMRITDPAMRHRIVELVFGIAELQLPPSAVSRSGDDLDAVEVDQS